MTSADTGRGFGPKKAPPAPKKVKKKSPTVGEEGDAVRRTPFLFSPLWSSECSHASIMPDDFNRECVPQAVQKALELAGNKTRPIDAGEAAKGRVDYANVSNRPFLATTLKHYEMAMPHNIACLPFLQVKNWGSGERKDFGKLQLESFKTGSQVPSKEQSFYTHLTFSVVQAEVSLDFRPCLQNAGKFYQ